MDEKMSFVADCLRGDVPMAALCEDYGISRKTGYKWLDRYREHGPAGLEDRSRAPHRHGRSMAPEVAEAIVALRRERPHWGPRKLRAVLMRDHPDQVWPAASTMGELLRAEGLVRPRRRRRLLAAPSRTLRVAESPNDVWCIDFKGWFRTRDRERCDPLTVTDAYSRYLLACVILPPRTEQVRLAVEQLFERYGLPETIRSDNGPPFAGTGAGGLSRLSVGWLKAGIALERIDPGQPQQNGRHERMHKTLKAETAKPPAASKEQQQLRFDRFRKDFNEYRPHEALGQQPPAAFYHPSPRPYQDTVFGGLMKAFPRWRFDKLVERHRADYRVRRLSSWSQLQTMVFAQLSGSRSLRETVGALERFPGCHAHLGLEPVRRSTLADANRVRPAALFEDVLEALVGELGRRGGRRGKEMLRLIDATRVMVGKRIESWEADGAVKLHVVYDPGADAPVCFAVTSVRMNDITPAKRFPMASSRRRASAGCGLRR